MQEHVVHVSNVFSSPFKSLIWYVMKLIKGPLYSWGVNMFTVDEGYWEEGNCASVMVVIRDDYLVERELKVKSKVKYQF